MLRYGSDMSSFLNDLKKMVSSIIVKQNAKASQYETVETKKKADRYLSMIEGGTEWGSFVNFNVDVLRAIGIDPDILDKTLANKELVPYELRSLAMSLQKKYIIDNYVEENEYYRMMNGERAIDDTDDIVVGPNSYGVRPDVPIQNLYEGEIEIINNSDILDILTQRYPDKGYLKHLGLKAVPYHKARRALNYDILYIEKNGVEEMCDEFIRYYAGARNYVMRGMYNQNSLDLFSNYDGFMGMVIVIMAINRTIASTFSQGIEHIFYDDSLIKDFFKSYNMPYHDTIGIKYQRELARKLNLLLQKKSSNNVLFDIVSLFDYNKVNIYEYHLVKDYYKDNDGNPMIRKKEIINENGELETVIDYEKTYDIYFQKVNIKSENKAMELTDPSNKLKFETVTGEDPYWINDADLISKLYSNKFNTVITKYLSIDVAFDITQLIYETCHFFRLIFDANAHTKSLKIDIPWVDEPVSLYDTVTFVCALVAKKFKLNGEIPLEPWNVAQVYGFNFKTDIEYLKQEIVRDIDNNHGEFSHIDPALLKLIKNGPLTDLDSVRALYNNIVELRKFLDTAMRVTTDIEAYSAYRKIYNSVLVTTDLAEVYTKSDGTYASTYMDLLNDRRPDLAKVVDETPFGEMVTVSEDGRDVQEYEAYEINTKINRLLDVLADFCENLNDLRFVNEKSEIVANIEKIINQMKSYTVDQQAAGIIYMLNDPHMCMLKVLDWLGKDNRLTLKCRTLIDSVLSQMRITHKFDDRLKLISDDSGVDAKICTYIIAMLKLSDLMYWEINSIGKSNIEFYDTISKTIKEVILPRLSLYIKEKYYIRTDIDLNDIINIDDKGEIYTSFIESLEKDNISIDDFNHDTRVALQFLMVMMVRDRVYQDVKTHYHEAINLIHKIWRTFKEEELDLDLDIFDSLTGFESLLNGDTILKHKCDVYRRFDFEDLIKLVNRLSISKDSAAKDALEFIDYMIFSKALMYKHYPILKDGLDVANMEVYGIEYLRFLDKLFIKATSRPKEVFDLLNTFCLIEQAILKNGLNFKYRLFKSTDYYPYDDIHFYDKIVEFFKDVRGADVQILDDACQECLDIKEQMNLVVDPKLHYWDQYKDYSEFIVLIEGTTISKAMSFKADLEIYENLHSGVMLDKYEMLNIFQKYANTTSERNDERIIFSHEITSVDKDSEISGNIILDDLLLFMADHDIRNKLGFDILLDKFHKDTQGDDGFDLSDGYSLDRSMMLSDGIEIKNDGFFVFEDKKYDVLNLYNYCEQFDDASHKEMISIINKAFFNNSATFDDNASLSDSHSIEDSIDVRTDLFDLKLNNFDKAYLPYLEGFDTKDRLIDSLYESVIAYFETSDTFLRAIKINPEEHLLYTIIYNNLDYDTKDKIKTLDGFQHLKVDYPDNTSIIGVILTLNSVEIITRNKPLNIIDNLDMIRDVDTSISLKDFMKKEYLD